MIQWLKDCKGDDFSEESEFYSLDKMRGSFKVVPLRGSGWLIVDDKAMWIKFAVMEFERSETDDSNVQLDCIFHGEGPVGNLRECRHTYWGENGYLFYPDGRIIADAFKSLSQYFDEME